MRRLSLFITLLLAAQVFVSSGFAAGGSPPFAEQYVYSGLHALCYHDVRDRVAKNFDTDAYAVSTENLAGQFGWLRTQGYHVVGADEVLAARSGGPALRPRSVLLTFDDGFRSVYTHVYPLLKLFGYKAVVSIVTDWIENDVTIPYNGRMLTREDFLTWEQIREMQASGLVEIASHTHDMHQGVPGNPQGNMQPAAITVQYIDGEYETADVYFDRLAADLTDSAAAIVAHTGVPPRMITWPFGAWNEPARQLATDLGMSLSLTLDSDVPIMNDGTIGRDMLVSNPGVPLFARMFGKNDARPVRAAQVDLDYVYDPDPERQELNLGLLLDRIQALEISHVFLQAFADPDADGAADAMYFPNRHLPMRADLFNRAAWQLATRANVKVFAWMPVLGYTWPDIDPGWQVLDASGDSPAPDGQGEPRLSPFRPDARQLIREIYADLARHADFDGIHFHDDGRMNEFEDANPAALAFYRLALGDDFTLQSTADDPVLAREWAALKARTISVFTLELADVVRQWRPAVKTSRNLFASALLDPDAMLYLAQDFDMYLDDYDLVSVMAMPDLENAGNREQFFRGLIDAVHRRPQAVGRTIFELQTVDWRDNTLIDSEDLRDTMRFLQSQGIRNLAYYPEDFIRGHPELETLKEGISLAEYPWRPGS